MFFLSLTILRSKLILKAGNIPVDSILPNQVFDSVSHKINTGTRYLFTASLLFQYMIRVFSTLRFPKCCSFVEKIDLKADIPQTNPLNIQNREGRTFFYRVFSLRKVSQIISTGGKKLLNIKKSVIQRRCDVRKDQPAAELCRKMPIQTGRLTYLLLKLILRIRIFNLFCCFLNS